MIDHTRLEKVRRTGDRITARCPACAAEGGDRSGGHLVVFPSGKFACAAHPGDSEHRRDIFRLVGINTPRDPEEQRQHRRARVIVEREAVKRKAVSRALIAKRAAIIAAHRWSEAEARRESPEQRLGWLHDPRRFIAALFQDTDSVWTGETRESGQNGRHAHRWQTVADWQSKPEHTVGPLTSPCTWAPGTTSRAAANVATSPFVVCDFDGFNGQKPTTPAAIRQHIADSIAIVRWMRERLDWQLAAILHTGNISLHAWFHAPPPAALESLRHTADALGIDAGLIGHPEHPCRLPGWIHAKTGTPSRVIWLQSSAP